MQARYVITCEPRESFRHEPNKDVQSDQLLDLDFHCDLCGPFTQRI